MMSLLEAWLASKVSNRMRESPLLRWNALRSPSKEAIFFSRRALSNRSVLPERMATYSE